MLQQIQEDMFKNINQSLSSNNAKINFKKVPIRDGFLTLEQAAKRLNISISSMYNLHRNGYIKGNQVIKNSPIYFSKKSIIELEKSYKRKTGASGVKASMIPVGYVSAFEAMKLTNLSSNQLYNLFHLGKIDGIQKCKGGRILCKLDSIKKFMPEKDDYKDNTVKLQSCNVEEEVVSSSIGSDRENKNIQSYMRLQDVVDLNTLALVFPQLRDFFAESRTDTLPEFIVNLIKICVARHE